MAWFKPGFKDLYYSCVVIIIGWSESPRGLNSFGVYNLLNLPVSSIPGEAGLGLELEDPLCRS